MDTAEQEAIQILATKRDLLSQILSVTERVKFTGSDVDAERFVALFEKRELLITEMQKCDEALSKEPYANLFEISSKDFKKESDKINNNLIAVATKLMALDKQIAGASGDILERLKKGMRDVKETKTVNSLYNDDLSVYDGYRFDQKQ